MELVVMVTSLTVKCAVELYWDDYGVVYSLTLM